MCIRDRAQVCVPTGNFGDILAGWYAMKMGAPISRLLLATNENDILARFFDTGEYSRGEVRQTLAPAMDIQVASNFERYLYYRVGEDPERLKALMDQFQLTGAFQLELGDAEAVDPDLVADTGRRQDCLDTIRQFYVRHDYLLDPHTAVGVSVAKRHQLDHAPTLCLATAHPAKFPDAVRQAVGEDVAHHPEIDALMQRPTRCETLPGDEGAVRRYIEHAVEDGL